MVREQHRLRALEVRVAGYERRRVSARDAAERALQGGQRGVDRVALGAEPEAQVRRDLIVPAPARVELAAERPDHLRQAALDRHVDVLVGALEAEGAGVELVLHAREARAAGARLRGG
jgi:hypothetical protein